MSKDALAYPGLVFPTVQALRQRGGHASIVEIDYDVATIMNLTDEVLAIRHGKTSRSEFEYRLAWVRTYLRIVGAVTNPFRGHWQLTELGHSITEEEAKDIFKRVRDMRREQEQRYEVDLGSLFSSSQEENDAEPDTDATTDQRPATFRFAIRRGKLAAEPFKADLSEADAVSLYNHLKRSAEALRSASKSTNSPMAALIATRADDLLSALGNDVGDLAAGDLLALWSAFESFSALLSTDEGVAETSLIIRQLSSEVLQRLSMLAALSRRVTEIVAYRNTISLTAEQAEQFDQLQSQLIALTASETFNSIIDNSVFLALGTNEDRKRAALATAENTTDIDARARANLDALDIRKLQALDTANFAAGLSEGIVASPTNPETNTAWQRFRVRLNDRFPEGMADAVIETAAAAIKSTPALAFAVLGTMVHPVFGALAVLAPAFFRASAKRLKDSLPE